MPTDHGWKEDGQPPSSTGQTAPLALKLQNKDAYVRQPMKSDKVLELMLHEVSMQTGMTALPESTSVRPARHSGFGTKATCKVLYQCRQVTDRSV